MAAFRLTMGEAAELEMCRRSFDYFKRYWLFTNREKGQILSFANPWPGQQALAEHMDRYPWLFALKAGKLGFTELECAFDAWAAMFRHPMARVHLFSKDQEAAKGMIEYIRFGLTHLPDWFGIRILNRMEATEEIVFRCAWYRTTAAEDRRTIASFAATGTGAIDKNATHTHMDELSHVKGEAQKALWNSVNTTVPDGGSIHIVTRGAGEVYTAELWKSAMKAPEEARGQKPFLYPFFVGYDGRPDRTALMRAQMADSGTWSYTGLAHFWPETWEDALAGDAEDVFIELSLWDSLKHGLGPLMPGDPQACVLALDAAIYRDCFAAVLVAPHPTKRNDVAVRAAKIWKPSDFKDHAIDFDHVEHWIRSILTGACRAGHPKCWAARHIGPENLCVTCWPTGPVDGEPVGCPECAAGEFAMPKYNIRQLCYDPHQIEDMCQGFRKEGLTWVKVFNQNDERLVSDSMMYGLARQGRLTHDGNPDVRQHIAGASMKVSKDDDTKLRIIKRNAESKIDAAVAISMGVKRCLDLQLTPAAASTELAGAQ